MESCLIFSFLLLFIIFCHAKVSGQLGDLFMVCTFFPSAFVVNLYNLFDVSYSDSLSGEAPATTLTGDLIYIKFISL